MITATSKNFFQFASVFTFIISSSFAVLTSVFFEYVKKLFDILQNEYAGQIKRECLIRHSLFELFIGVYRFFLLLDFMHFRINLLFS